MTVARKKSSVAPALIPDDEVNSLRVSRKLWPHSALTTRTAPSPAMAQAVIGWTIFFTPAGALVPIMNPSIVAARKKMEAVAAKELNMSVGAKFMRAKPIARIAAQKVIWRLWNGGIDGVGTNGSISVLIAERITTVVCAVATHDVINPATTITRTVISCPPDRPWSVSGSITKDGTKNTGIHRAIHVVAGPKNFTVAAAA